ncbi:MAG: hypothetical protein ABR602_04515, partial [Gemmatimonadales bacterium]
DIGAASTAGVGVLALLGHAVYDVVRVRAITAARQSPSRWDWPRPGCASRGWACGSSGKTHGASGPPGVTNAAGLT